MAASPDAIRITRGRGVVLGLFLALTCTPLRAQTRISLAQLGFRTGPDYVSHLRRAESDCAGRGIGSGLPLFGL